MLHFFFLFFFFHLLTNFTKDLPIDRPHPHPRSSILLSKMLQHFIKCSFLGDRNIRWPKWLRSTCILSVNCTQNWELPVALSVTWQTCGDVKIKHEERVHNRVISSWTRVGDGVKKSIKKINGIFTCKTFTGDQFFKNSPSQVKLICAWTSLNEYDPQILQRFLEVNFFN